MNISLSVPVRAWEFGLVGRIRPFSLASACSFSKLWLNLVLTHGIPVQFNSAVCRAIQVQFAMQGGHVWQPSATFIICLVAIGRGIVSLMRLGFLYFIWVWGLASGYNTALLHYTELCSGGTVRKRLNSPGSSSLVVLVKKSCKSTWSWARVRYRTYCWRD